MIIRHRIILFSAGFWLFILFMTASANAYEFPPYRGIDLKVTGSISENYSNNVTYAFENENKVEDFRTMLNLGLDFTYKGERRSLGLSGRLNREIFADSSNERNPSESVTLTFNNDFSEYDRLRFINTFRHTQEPGSFQGGYGLDQCREYYRNYGFSSDKIEILCNEFAEEFGRFKGKFDSYSNLLNLTYYKIISKYYNVSAGYRYGQNWSNEEGTNDSDRHGLGLTVNYQYSQPTMFSLSYNYQISNYEIGEDISRQSITAGIKQYITRRLYFDGKIGTDQTISGNGDDSIRGNATITNEFDEKTTATISYSQGTRINANTDGTFKSWQVTGSFARALLDELYSRISAFYGQGDFSSTDVSDTLLGASINLFYDFWRGKRGSNMGAEIGYYYSDLDSSDEGRGYTRNSIDAGITLAF